MVFNHVRLRLRVHSELGVRQIDMIDPVREYSWISNIKDDDIWHGLYKQMDTFDMFNLLKHFFYELI